MKKVTYAFLLMLLSSFAILSGCKKDDEEPAPSKTTLLSSSTGKKWGISSAIAQTPLGDFDLLTETTFNYLKDCNKDDLMVFYSDKKYEVNSSTKKCSSTEPDVTSAGTWELSSDEKQITLAQVSGTSIFPASKPITLTEVTATTLKGTYSDNVQGFPVTVNLTLAAQ